MHWYWKRYTPASSEGDAIEKELANILEKRRAQKGRRSRSARQSEADEPKSGMSSTSLSGRHGVYDSSRSVMRLADSNESEAVPNISGEAGGECESSGTPNPLRLSESKLRPAGPSQEIRHDAALEAEAPQQDDESFDEGHLDPVIAPSLHAKSQEALPQELSAQNPQCSPFEDVPVSFQIWPGLTQDVIPPSYQHRRMSSSDLSPKLDRAKMH